MKLKKENEKNNKKKLKEILKKIIIIIIRNLVLNKHDLEVLSLLEFRWIIGSD